ncbi:Hypp4455 [Branchiostoma lanceolatum]|uniref:Hypp4455 protein n=1 Tax=Branchiostoma lanceolatum TaxID=7740 RepID=A0A8K0EY66_BRALA|nr:Hypp4455 [Branchiostoma lanceolatum]
MDRVVILITNKDDNSSRTLAMINAVAMPLVLIVASVCVLFIYKCRRGAGLAHLDQPTRKDDKESEGSQNIEPYAVVYSDSAEPQGTDRTSPTVRQTIEPYEQPAVPRHASFPGCVSRPSSSPVTGLSRGNNDGSISVQMHHDRSGEAHVVASWNYLQDIPSATHISPPSSDPHLPTFLRPTSPHLPPTHISPPSSDPHLPTFLRPTSPHLPPTHISPPSSDPHLPTFPRPTTEKLTSSEDGPGDGRLPADSEESLEHVNQPITAEEHVNQPITAEEHVNQPITAEEHVNQPITAEELFLTVVVSGRNMAGNSELRSVGQILRCQQKAKLSGQQKVGRRGWELGGIPGPGADLISTHKQLSAQEGGRPQVPGRWGQNTSAPVATSVHSRHRYTWSAPGGGTNTNPSSSSSAHKLVKTTASSTKTTATASTHKLVRQATAAPVSGHMTVTMATTGFSSGRPTSGVVPVSRPTSHPARQGSLHPSNASGSNVTMTTAASQGSSQYRWAPAGAATTPSGVVQRTVVPPADTNMRTAVPPANTSLQKLAAPVVKSAVTASSSTSQPVSTDRVVSTKYSLKKVSSAQLSPSKASTPRTTALAGVQPSTGQVLSSRYRLRKTGTGSDSLPAHSRAVHAAGTSGVVSAGSLPAHSRTVHTAGTSGVVSSGSLPAHSRSVHTAGTSGVVSSRYRLSKVAPGGTNKSGSHRLGVRGKTPSPRVLASKHKLRRHPSAARGSGVSKTPTTLSKKSPAGFVAMGKYKLRAKRAGTPAVRRRKSGGAVVSRYRLVKPGSAADTDRQVEH